MASFTLSETAGRLATFTAPGRVLHGLLFETGRATCAVVVHVHGMCGNFYHNRFVPTLAGAYNAAGLDMLTVNTSAHDYVAESLDGDTPIFAGGAVVDQEAVDQDLHHVLAVLAERYTSIVLQGHSFGCDVITRNAGMFPSNIAGCVLLSPADSLALQEAYTEGVPVAAQLDELRRRAAAAPASPGRSAMAQRLDVGIGWLGIATPELHYEIPCSLPAAISFLASGPGVFRYGDHRNVVPGVGHLSAFAYLGGRDHLLLDAQECAVDMLSRSFGTLETYQPPDGDHHFTGLERDVGRRAAEWAARQVGMGGTGRR